MADERIDIEIQDKVAPTISKKILEIADSAKVAHNGLEKLKAELASLNSSSIDKLSAASARLTNSLARETQAQAKLLTAQAKMQSVESKSALLKQKVATEAERTALAFNKAQVAANSLSIAKQKLAISTSKATAEEFKAEQALNRAIIAETKAASESVKLQVAKNNEASSYFKAEQALNKSIISENNAAASSVKLATAKNNETQSYFKAEQALNKAIVSEKNITLAEQKLATESNKTALAQNKVSVSANQVAASQSRAELAALRLQNAQNKAASGAYKHHTSLLRLIRTAMIFTGITFSGTALVGAADSYTNLQNKLRNVSDSEKQVTELTRELFQVANSTRAPIDDTARAFQRFDLALVQLGKSQRESLQLTETVNQSLVLSGATTGEQTAALLQLSQAFNKGKLDGDEFRTVMELMPTVADAIAKQLKVTRGELLNLAPKGKITADVMAKAFANARVEIGEKFAKIVPTVGQAFTVLSNNAVKFFGEINKSYGITNSLAKGIIFLSEHLRELSLGLSVIGAALLVAFGPAILTAIASATAAVWSFTAAIAANPVGLLIVGLTAAISYLVMFRDEIKLTDDGVVSLADGFKAAFELIGNLIEPITSFFSNAWKIAFEDVSDLAGNLSNTFAASFSDVLKFVKIAVNGYIASWVFGYNAIVKYWNNFPAAFKDIVSLAFNSSIDVVQNGVNWIISKLSTLLKLANEASEYLGQGTIFDTNFKADFSTYKAEITGAGAELGSLLANEAEKAFSTDFLGNALNAFETKAREIANARIASSNSSNSLRGEGTNLNPNKIDEKAAAKAAKAAEKRANALARVNRELDSELRLLGLLGPERELVQRFDEISNSLANKKVALSEKEKIAIMNKLIILQKEKGVQEQLQNIYNETTAVYTEFSEKLEATNRAYKRGIIDATSYKNRISDLNKEISDFQLTNGLKKGVAEELKSVYDSSIGAYNKIADSLEATNIAYERGIINAETYASKLAEIGVQAANLRLQLGDGTWSDVFTSAMGKVVANYQGTLPAMSEAFGNLFTTLSDGFANSIGQAIVYSDNLGESLRDVARSAIAELISAIIKMGIQWVMMQIMQQGVAASALAVQTAASAAAAAATATAWATPAALVSLASYGANSGPAMAGITATTALTQSLAAASGAGFKEGGFTGLGRTDEIAGVVHKREFVMDAASTERIGIDNLEALQKGAARVSSNSSVSGSANSSEDSSTNSENTALLKEIAQSLKNQKGSKVVNAFDRKTLAEEMSGSEGLEVQLNHVTKNRSKFRSALGL